MVLVDPPKGGLDPATITLCGGHRVVLYVSCNQVTLARALDALSATHVVHRFAFMDHFPYSSQSECGAMLVRKAASALSSEPKHGVASDIDQTTGYF